MISPLYVPLRFLGVFFFCFFFLAPIVDLIRIHIINPSRFPVLYLLCSSHQQHIIGRRHRRFALDYRQFAELDAVLDRLQREPAAPAFRRPPPPFRPLTRYESESASEEDEDDYDDAEQPPMEPEEEEEEEDCYEEEEEEEEEQEVPWEEDPPPQEEDPEDEMLRRHQEWFAHNYQEDTRLLALANNPPQLTAEEREAADAALVAEISSPFPGRDVADLTRAERQYYDRYMGEEGRRRIEADPNWPSLMAQLDGDGRTAAELEQDYHDSQAALKIAHEHIRAARVKAEAEAFRFGRAV